MAAWLSCCYLRLRPCYKSEKVLRSGIKIPYHSPYVPEKFLQQQFAERQQLRLVVFPSQRPPSRTPQVCCAEVPVWRRDVRGVRLGRVAADPLSRSSAPGGERRFEQVVSRAPSPDM